MKRFLLAMALVVVGVSVSSNVFAHRDHQNQASSDDIICKMVHPWPFNHGEPPVDSDGDGVFDKMDKCPGTPRGATVDANGCPTDTDGDGVVDGLDRCPNSPAGAMVDGSGCPKDSDSDGVFDGIDKCPDTPRGALVDATGCHKDTDGDGVADGIDQCPDTNPEWAVDSKGCPIPVSEVMQQFIDEKSVSVPIQFDSGKDTIKPESEEYLHRVGKVLADWPAAKVEIGGHTDAQGAEKFNETLSAKRADAVKKWLTSNYPAIQGGNLSTRGYGESTPIAPNDTPEGMAQNRRVTFTLMNAAELGKDIETKRYKKRGE
jgi:OOP family OmpA-OmpF porin